MGSESSNALLLASNSEDSSIGKVSEVDNVGVAVTGRFPSPLAQCKAAFSVAPRVLFLSVNAHLEILFLCTAPSEPGINFSSLRSLTQS